MKRCLSGGAGWPGLRSCPPLPGVSEGLSIPRIERRKKCSVESPTHVLYRQERTTQVRGHSLDLPLRLQCGFSSTFHCLPPPPPCILTFPLVPPPTLQDNSDPSFLCPSLLRVILPSLTVLGANYLLITPRPRASELKGASLTLPFSLSMQSPSKSH